MAQDNGIRENEVQVTPPEANDAGLIFIGRISTPWTARSETPRQGSHTGPICRIEIFEPWVAALKGVETFERLEILYWLHQARRDLVLQSPASSGKVHGTFSLRSPVRPNPIGTSIVVLEGVEGNVLLVRGMDCLDGTPLLDLKPDRSLFKPIVSPQPGEAEPDSNAPTAHYCQKA
ncbi:tRNA (N6-threonylcarbamoyladenosine(37)-N6)-methyltransferase TrmO [Rhizobium sp. CFBP 13726]|uniref:tRNA (N6-threonylcarbamoyladenosine(37)-N6)-methyltransferase TrmO n=1 Tax=Rhizobium sp. CFBP 13726 TaxID=2775296 RepID=UPI00177AB970|nr:tRNA (N6-threonylcarbamoyladenosine(37)-N6)-methyltransferase TrmO [Rhizobium sp. CFBP 13726]MBD8651904.1 tRNA (N6-threonylcarbamoyladenosine(37)-N6)-methyltransferase TrmO [Rhizobium sp. CFBP 13726]